MAAGLLVNARMAAELLLIRASLRNRLKREPLDELLIDLTARHVGHPAATQHQVRRLLRLVEPMVARLPGVPNTCLYRSLARYAVLRRAGCAAQFFVALPPAGPSESGHAWIQIDGRPYDTADAQQSLGMVVTFRYPPDTDPSS